MISDRFPMAGILALLLTILGCSVMEENSKKSGMSGLIVTLPSYYSTPKGRYLGSRYRENLDRLVERIARDPKTAKLQFANNIASLGGIGFFTHAAAKNPDERFLEVILGAPEVFESKGDYGVKVDRLFSLYGADLLGILAGDTAIYQEKEVSGYGLNFSWRNVGAKVGEGGVILERAVVYFSKEKVRAFLQQQIGQDGLLDEATIFAAAQDGAMSLVNYRGGGAKDSRASVEEQKIAGAKAEPKSLIVETPLRSSAGEESKQRQSVKKEQLAPVAADATVKQNNAPEQKPAQPVVGKPENRTAETAAVPAARSEPASKGIEKSGGEPIASLRSSRTESAPEKKPLVRPLPTTLEGFIIQLAFTEANAAQQWAKTLGQRGYRVSLTEAGGEGSFRLRVGNFALREEAERQLRSLRQEGLAGIIINLPQAYRPETRFSAPPGAEKPSSITR